MQTKTNKLFGHPFNEVKMDVIKKKNIFEHPVMVK